MKLTFKLTLALVCVLALLFSVYGFFLARHQSAFLEKQSQYDAFQVGRTLGLAVARSWRLQGPDEAIALVDEANVRTSAYVIRLVQLSGQPTPELRPDLSEEMLQGVVKDEPLNRRIDTPAGETFQYSYVLVPLDEPPQLAIEVRESLGPERNFARESLLRVFLFLAVVVGATGCLLWVLGHFIVGRRIELIRGATKRIGTGDFGSPLELRGNDEIAELGEDVNRMSRELQRMSDLVRAESEEKLRVLEQLRHADRLSSIGSLAAGVAHELGTPLSIISAHAVDIVNGAAGSSPLKKAAEEVLRQADRMGGIVRQLLDFARAGPSEKSEIDLVECVRGVHSLLAPFAEKRSVPLQCRLPVNGVRIHADKSQIEQVLANILLNAIQASESGEVALEVDVNGARPAGYQSEKIDFVCIRVTDGGAGMAPEVVKRIFDPYFTTKPVGKGTGMGLSIAEGIVRDHGGFIEVHSAVGKGSEFKVFIPRRVQ